MQQTLYVVGRPFHTRASIDQLHANGYKVGVFLDKNFNSKLQQFYDTVIELDFASIESIPNQLEAYRDLDIDGLLCNYENFLLARSKIANFYNLAAPSQQSAAYCTDKLLMRQALQAYNPTITPNFALIETEANALNFAKINGYPLIIKPTNLVKSLLVLRCDNHAELIKNYNFARQEIQSLYQKYNIYDRQPQLLIEGYITGKSYSVAALVDASGQPHFCGAITSITTAHDISVSDNYLYARQLPGDVSESDATKIFQVAAQAVKALAMTSTAAHIEIINAQHGPQIVEVGARTGGYRQQMYQAVYGFDLLTQEAQLALGLQPEVTTNARTFCSVFELFPQKTGSFVKLSGNLRAIKGVQQRLRVEVGQRVGPAKAGFKASAVVILQADSQAELHALQQYVDALEVITT